MEGTNNSVISDPSIQIKEGDSTEQKTATQSISKPSKKSILSSSLLFKIKQKNNEEKQNSQVINIYKDDEPLEVIDDEVNQQNNSKMQNLSEKLQNYNLDEGLKVEVKSSHKYFQFSSIVEQILPIMISIEATELKKEKEQQYAKDIERPSIDLVCVIDNSGSMEGEKIKNVKRALSYMLTLLNKNDRICLILFNSNATRLCNLMRVDETNKISLQRIIDGIYSTGGTSINSGMQIAFQVLKDRQFINQVSSVFLLSDGLDSKAHLQVQQSLNSYQIEECFTIDSFGFGDDHDAEMMNQISNLKDGSFYYVEDIDSIDEFFCDAIGGLFSVVAQEINVEVKLNFIERYQKFFKDVTVSNTFGKQWKVIKKDDSYAIQMNKLITGASKDFVFEMKIPPQKVDQIEDFERNAEVINVEVSAIPINPTYTTRLSKSSNLILTLFLENEKVSEDGEGDEKVEYNYLRVKASEAMEEALSQQKQSQYDNAEQILNQMIDRISNSSNKVQSKLQLIQKDLKEFKANSKPEYFNTKTTNKVLSSISGSMRQSGGHFLGSYSNSLQKGMISSSLKFKSSPPIHHEAKKTDQQDLYSIFHQQNQTNQLQQEEYFQDPILQFNDQTNLSSSFQASSPVSLKNLELKLNDANERMEIEGETEQKQSENSQQSS